MESRKILAIWNTIKLVVLILFTMFLSAIIAIQSVTALFGGFKNQYKDFILYGVWKSENPNITLYISPENGKNDYSGIYVVNGKEVKIMVSVNMPPRGDITIKNMSAEDMLTGNKSSSESYIKLSLLIKKDTIEASLNSEDAKKLGYKKIIFERIDTYSNSMIGE